MIARANLGKNRETCVSLRGFVLTFLLLFVLLSVNFEDRLLDVVFLKNKFYSDEYILQLAERVS